MSYAPTGKLTRSPGLEHLWKVLRDKRIKQIEIEAKAGRLYAVRFDFSDHGHPPMICVDWKAGEEAKPVISCEYCLSERLLPTHNCPNCGAAYTRAAKPPAISWEKAQEILAEHERMCANWRAGDLL